MTGPRRNKAGHPRRRVRLCASRSETDSKPKPMVEIGGRPILWHIAKIYAHHGIEDFIICLGYKGSKIKEYFFH